METADVVVIGAGVVGLAVARQLARAGRNVIVLERESLIGSITSSRNSEVIHAGIYYPKDSLKALTCVRGKALLYDFCASYGVAHRNCGKVIVAADPSQTGDLDAIRARANANGVADLRVIDRVELAELEPAVHGVMALLSPSTGIIDSHGYMLALQGDAEANGAMIAFDTPVTDLTLEHGGPIIRTGGADPFEMKCRTLVNASGLDAPALARATAGLPDRGRPATWFAKGSYYVLAGRSPFNRLIYPVPEPGGLGVHVTIDIGGDARFGPDVEWLEATSPAEIDYTVDPRRADGFYAAVRRYWPDLADGALLPGYSGVRPKLSPPGAAAADFRIDGVAEHGCAGLINLFGIESPGLTASLALAEIVAEKVTAA
ncbi:MAG: NAD(P)/FAD-dependent oxidoreductase [Minwuia sp.]|nr:NAD(P)/FAD-dependent oxidoreductase [Minwuia sp.]